MKKRLLMQNSLFAAVLLITYFFLDHEGHIARNTIIIGLIMALFIAINYITLNRLWFRHIDDMNVMVKEMKDDKEVQAFELSKEEEIQELQYGLESLSKHVTSMATKYGYRKGQLEAILSSLKLGLVAITQEGKVIFHNPKFSEIYLLNSSIQGKNIYENIYDTDLLEVLEESLHSEIYTLPNKIQTNGLVFSYKGLEITSKEERIGTLIIIEDVTKVYRVDKMKSDFVSNVTHELKTPLTSIRGFTETLQHVDPNDIETRDKFLGIIEKESERLSLLINDILYLSEVEGTVATQKDEIDINRTINEVIELSRQNLNAGVELVFEAEQNYIVQFEHYKLKQMILNLVSNSVKYTDEGSITVSLSDDSDYVILKVIDTGIGIPKEDQGRIFERFYRVDKGRSRQTGGTGLGLSIVKHIVERNDCQMHLESEAGVGTTITVFIKK